MKTKPTLTIGIPAYNEEKNIEKLILSLFEQEHNSFILEKIIVISDGSDDSTADVIRLLKKRKVHLVIHPLRKGKSESLNEICSISTTDILVIIDADIVVKDVQMIEKLIYPILKRKAGIVSAHVKDLNSKSFFSKVLSVSMKFKQEVYMAINSGNNIYTCHGRCIALVKKLYKKLDYTQYIADDAYSYLFAKKNVINYQFVSDAHVYYRLPRTIDDHLIQSSRFFSTQKQFYNEFGIEFIKQEYLIPNKILIPKIIKYIFNEPVRFMSYLMILVWIKFFKSKKMPPVAWRIALSSKE